MNQQWAVNQIAVLGAGVMGAQIAAHCVNAGFKTYLFDIASVDKAIQNLTKLSPSPLACKEMAALIQPCDYEKDLEKLQGCSLIIEAIAEKVEWKLDLYKKISPHIAPNALLVTNTSGLSITQLSTGLDKSLQARFCGVHFFNPPRYMSLVELIPTPLTPKSMLDTLETWLTSYMGKTVVIAKDTPNFIANRIGVFSMLSVMHHAAQYELGFDEVDVLTGPLLGRPKSATFRTMDVVGLDTMSLVVKTMDDNLKEDPWHHYFHLPTWLNEMIDKKHLGQKTGQGIYRKQGKVIEVFDLNTATYRSSEAQVSEEVQSIFSDKDKASLWQRLSSSKDRQAQFLTDCLTDIMQYSAYHLKSIATTVRDIDEAMKCGFGWKQGPFEMWQMLGVDNIRNSFKSDIPMPSWLCELPYFYYQGKSYNPFTTDFIFAKTLPVYQKQMISNVASKSVLFENEGVVLYQQIDDIAVLQFKTKMNAINAAVIDGLNQSISIAESQSMGLILCQNNPATFSAGADLKMVESAINNEAFTELDARIKGFQEAVMRMKYANIPVVAAMRGQALGGGAELLLHCDKIVASFESYIGLVEVGAGVLPAGGGCKEFALRASKEVIGTDPLPFLYRYYQNIAMASVTNNAKDASLKGFMRPQDIVIMNSEEVLYTAIGAIKSMQASNYRPPLPVMVQVVGIEGAARLKAGLVNWLEGGFISKHDYLIADKIADVMTGGNVNQGTLVTEQWLLNLEREAFIELTKTKETQARIHALLTTGKPLRN